MMNHTKAIARRCCPRTRPALQSRITTTKCPRTAAAAAGGSTPQPPLSSVAQSALAAGRRYKATTTITTPSGSSAIVAGTTASSTTGSSSSSSSSSGYGARLWQLYVRNLEARPLFTKAFLASFIFFASDSATQYILPTPPATSTLIDESDDEKKQTDAAIQLDTRSFIDRWDAPRALAAASFGVIATCYLHYWWNMLEVVLGRFIPTQRYRLANTAVKVVIDQGMGAPCYIYSYYTLTNFFQDLQEGKKDAATSWKETNAKASEMLWPTMLQHWKVWPLVHSLNFYYTPLHHRVLVQNCVLVGWSGYLSHLNHRGGELMTPDEEIKVTIVRRETERRLAQKELQKTIG